MNKLRFIFAITLCISLFYGCGHEVDSVLRIKKALPQQVISLGAIEAEQMLPVQVDGEDYLLLASERRGLILINPFGEIIAAQEGRVERLAVQALPNKNLMVASYDEGQAQLNLHEIRPTEGERKLDFRLLSSQKMHASQSALCFSHQEERTHLFTIGEDGIGYEYLLLPAQQQWQLQEMRPLYFGEQINACAVNSKTQHLLVSQPPIGILSLNANAEKDEQRELVLSGQWLGEDFGNLWLDTQNESLWLTADDQVRRYSLNSLKEEPDWHLHIDESHTVISPLLLNGQLFALDDGRDQLLIFDQVDSDSLSSDLSVTATESDNSIVSVFARNQTEPVQLLGDAADDPAIWVNKSRPQNSLILATDKKSGLNVYDLSGKLLEHFPVGRVNNVDIRSIDHPLYSAVAAASNRSIPGVNLFAITFEGRIEHLGLRTIDLQDPYGLCLQKTDNRLFAWISDKDAALHQFAIELDLIPSEFSLKEEAEMAVNSQVEGCVVDDERQTLFFAEEDRGIWSLDLVKQRSGESQPRLLAEVDGKILADDVEGLALYLMEDSGYLIASSQGNDSYALFSRDGGTFVGHFRVDVNMYTAIDGSSETDGLDVTSANLGPEYPMGLLVIQDGRNRLPNAPQNFKLVGWDSVNEALSLKTLAKK
ncbi:phytase [Microbulbifer variabilis]|uniref:phytase n=1 Tax=Microbulbifer variabilis TaxID=266805 RepID=UPI001CFE8A17|nr:phytase [Microbulbifer variabilis]